jgi:hypothetical protein
MIAGTYDFGKGLIVGTLRHMKKITSQRCDGYFASGKEVGSADSGLSKGSADAVLRKISR